MATARTWILVLKDCVVWRLGRFVKKVQNEYHVIYQDLTLRGQLYRRRYQLVFFKTSAKDIKNTPSILVVQISVIYQLKL